DEDLPGERGLIGPLAQHLVEQLGPADDVAPRLLEEVEELTVSRDEHLRQARHGTSSCGVLGSGCPAAAPRKRGGSLAARAAAPRAGRQSTRIRARSMRRAVSSPAAPKRSRTAAALAAWS